MAHKNKLAKRGDGKLVKPDNAEKTFSPFFSTCQKRQNLLFTFSDRTMTWWQSQNTNILLYKKKKIALQSDLMISSDTIKCHPVFIVIGSRQFQSIVSWFPCTLLYRQHYLHFFRWRLTTCFLFFFVITKWRETKTWLTYKKCTTTERRGESRTVQGSDDAGLVSPPSLCILFPFGESQELRS